MRDDALSLLSNSKRAMRARGMLSGLRGGQKQALSGQFKVGGREDPRISYTWIIINWGVWFYQKQPVLQYLLSQEKIPSLGMAQKSHLLHLQKIPVRKELLSLLPEQHEMRRILQKVVRIVRMVLRRGLRVRRKRRGFGRSICWRVGRAEGGLRVVGMERIIRIFLKKCGTMRRTTFWGEWSLSRLVLRTEIHRYSNEGLSDISLLFIYRLK